MKRSKSVLEAYLNVWGDLMRNWLRNLGFYQKTLTRNENKAWLCLDLGKFDGSCCVLDVGHGYGVEEEEKHLFASLCVRNNV